MQRDWNYRPIIGANKFSSKRSLWLDEGNCKLLICKNFKTFSFPPRTGTCHWYISTKSTGVSTPKSDKGFPSPKATEIINSNRIVCWNPADRWNSICIKVGIEWEKQNKSYVGGGVAWQKSAQLLWQSSKPLKITWDVIYGVNMCGKIDRIK